MAGVLARILKMSVQNRNYKISARPDIASQLLIILMPPTFKLMAYCIQGLSQDLKKACLKDQDFTKLD